MKLDTLQRIEIAEGVEIRLRPAGPMVRLAAGLIDLAIQLGIFLALSILIRVVSSAVGSEIGLGVFLILFFLLYWFYSVPFEAGKRGATPGKRAMKLRVVQVNGGPVTWGQAFVRSLLRIVDGLPPIGLVPATYLVGMFFCLTTRSFQRLGDLAAGTVVIYVREAESYSRLRPPPLGALEPLAPTIVLSREEQQAIVAFYQRASLWSDERKIELAGRSGPLAGPGGVEGVWRLWRMAAWLLRESVGPSSGESSQTQRSLLVPPPLVRGTTHRLT